MGAKRNFLFLSVAKTQMHENQKLEKVPIHTLVLAMTGETGLW